MVVLCGGQKGTVRVEAQVESQYKVTVINCDPSGNYWRETLLLNDALLKIMRFARTDPQSSCTIELRQSAPIDIRIVERGERDESVTSTSQDI